MLHVRNVVGRYPNRAVVRSDNIVATVVEIGRVYRIRIDDEEHPNAFVELIVEDDLGEPRQEANRAIARAG